MLNDYPDDLKLRYALFKLQDVLEAQQEHPDPDFLDISSHRDEVHAQY